MHTNFYILNVENRRKYYEKKTDFCAAYGSHGRNAVFRNSICIRCCGDVYVLDNVFRYKYLEPDRLGNHVRVGFARLHSIQLLWILDE